MIRTTISGSSFWLDAPVVTDYLAALKAGCPIGITSAGRDWAAQQRLRDRWLAYEAYKLYQQGYGPYAPYAPYANFALPPEDSMHCLGRALDLPGRVGDKSTPRGWMRAHGKQFGFTPVANEDWHFDHHSTTAVTAPLEDDMPLSDDDVNRVARAVLGAEMPDRGVSWLVGIKRLYDRVPEDIPAAVWAEPLAGGPSAGRYVSHTREIALGLSARVGALEASDLTDADLADLTAAIKSLPAAVVAELKARL